MTWGTRIVRADGNTPLGSNACDSCVHGKYVAPRAPCNIKHIATSVGYLLTSIDVGMDGHMACGTAELKCNGFEEIKEGGAA